MDAEELIRKVIGAAINVHRELGSPSNASARKTRNAFAPDTTTPMKPKLINSKTERLCGINSHVFVSHLALVLCVAFPFFSEFLSFGFNPL